MTPSAAHALHSSPDLVRELHDAWPLPQPERTAGYRPLPLGRTGVVDACRCAPRVAVAVIADASGAHAALPLVDDGGWRVAGAGDGPSAWLVETLVRSAGLAGSQDRFQLAAFASLPTGAGSERALGTDQTNTSIVVDDRVIVKWRTASEADGLRAMTLRRHLGEVGFPAMAPLLGALTWTAPDGAEIVLADVDGFLPGAEDGWDAFIAELVGCLEAPPADALELARDLGQLAGELHAALSTPSSIIRAPQREAGREAVAAWREAGLRLVDRAVDIDAEDAEDVRRRAAALRRDVDELRAIGSAPVQPVHGDLHIGQVIRWRAGLAVIDFDGPPGTRPVEGRLEPFDREPAARDLAQLLCSLDLLAVVADARTEGRHEAALRTWVGAARETCLGAYRSHAPAGLLDERLLAPFLAAQLCRELVYAAEVLPRWRYAPIGALRWRYPEVAS